MSTSKSDLFGTSKFAKTADPLPDQPKRAITEAATITEAAILFSKKDGGLHTFRIGDEVTFTDRYLGVHTGIIVQFERVEGLTYITVREDEGSHYVELRRVHPAGSPGAERLIAESAAAQTHLAAGTLVRVTLPAGKSYGGVGNGDLAVVLQDKGQRVNVARLGGHKDAYARLSHTALVVVSPEEVLKP